MLPKLNRLPRKNFLLTKSNGKKYSTPHFSVLVYLNRTPNEAFGEVGSHFSIVTSIKLSKSAVVRNRLRRQIYSHLSPTLYPLSSSIIFYPRPSMLKLTSDQISFEINSFLSTLSPQA